MGSKFTKIPLFATLEDAILHFCDDVFNARFFLQNIVIDRNNFFILYFKIPDFILFFRLKLL